MKKDEKRNKMEYKKKNVMDKYILSSNRSKRTAQMRYFKIVESLKPLVESNLVTPTVYNELTKAIKGYFNFYRNRIYKSNPVPHLPLLKASDVSAVYKTFKKVELFDNKNALALEMIKTAIQKDPKLVLNQRIVEFELFIDEIMTVLNTVHRIFKILEPNPKEEPMAARSQYGLLGKREQQEIMSLYENLIESYPYNWKIYLTKLLEGNSPPSIIVPLPSFGKNSTLEEKIECMLEYLKTIRSHSRIRQRENIPEIEVSTVMNALAEIVNETSRLYTLHGVAQNDAKRKVSDEVLKLYFQACMEYDNKKQFLEDTEYIEKSLSSQLIKIRNICKKSQMKRKE
jgi:hypothetical protein